MEKYILCESKLDYKYKMLFSKLDKDFVIIEGGFIKLMKVLIRKKSFYHIRYIKYRGPIITSLKLLIIFVFCKFSQSKIIWTCHNIHEHNIKSKKINDILRYVISKISSDIIVFHKDLIKYLPKSALGKTHVASFGNFKEFTESKENENIDFKNNYRAWLNHLNISSPNIIFISAAKKNNLKLLIDGVTNKDINCLIINPKSTFDYKEFWNNIFFYNKFVYGNINNILNTKSKIIGYVGHDNISVPTSLYMYASYKIPIISINKEPLNTIINEYEIGIVVTKSNEIEVAYKSIIHNYDKYQNNISIFNEKNNWRNSAKIHNKILQ